MKWKLLENYFNFDERFCTSHKSVYVKSKQNTRFDECWEISSNTFFSSRLTHACHFRYHLSFSILLEHKPTDYSEVIQQSWRLWSIAQQLNRAIENLNWKAFGFAEKVSCLQTKSLELFLPRAIINSRKTLWNLAPDVKPAFQISFVSVSPTYAILT